MTGDDIVDKQRFDISLEHLQTFLVVADLGSFSGAAAEHLNLAQPSVSNRFRRLEEKLTTMLLERTTRKSNLPRTAFAFMRGLLRRFSRFIVFARNSIPKVTYAAGRSMLQQP